MPSPPPPARACVPVSQLFGILLTLAEAIAFVLSGMYGPLSALGAGNAILIVCQLFLMGVALILMDQVLQKGCVRWVLACLMLL